jgi:putative Mg2+ transporter-C (MgtC) family protein
VATGIGFLGAGEIVVPRQADAMGAPEVRGLSSAASIWFTAALGVTVAASSPLVALLALALALVTLSNRLSWPPRLRRRGDVEADQNRNR